MACTDYTGDLYIEITDKCNLLCKHCYNNSCIKKENAYLSKTDFKTILEHASHCGINSIAISGGEPLLNPDLLDILRLTAKKGFLCRIITNGTLVDYSLLHMIPPNISFQISLDGSSAETHELLTNVSGSFIATCAAIDKLNEVGTPFSIKTIISPYNCSDLHNLVDFAIVHKAKGISFSFLQPIGRALNNQDLFLQSPALVQLYLDTLLPLFEEYRGFVSGPKIQNTRCPLLCANDTDEKKFVVSPRIDVYGNVYPCAMFVSKRFSLGNILQDSFDAIFSSKRFSELVQYMYLREKYVGDCLNCFVSSKCGRGCPASSLETDVINPNFYCKMVKWKMMSDAIRD